nr:MAG TPA: hypothetical protein [Caudoviricetes sp.]
MEQKSININSIYVQDILFQMLILQHLYFRTTL